MSSEQAPSSNSSPISIEESMFRDSKKLLDIEIWAEKHAGVEKHAGDFRSFPILRSSYKKTGNPMYEDLTLPTSATWTSQEERDTYMAGQIDINVRRIDPTVYEEHGQIALSIPDPSVYLFAVLSPSRATIIEDRAREATKTDREKLRTIIDLALIQNGTLDLDVS